MERAEQLLTPDGRAAAPPETNAISVDATDEGYENIRQFLVDNDWDFSQDASYPDFDRIAPISELHGVLYVREMSEMINFLIVEPARPYTGMDLQTSVP